METTKQEKVDEKVCEGLIVERYNSGRVIAKLHYSDIKAEATTVERALAKLAVEASEVLDLPQEHGHCTECDTDYELTEMGLYQCNCGTFLSRKQ